MTDCKIEGINEVEKIYTKSKKPRLKTKNSFQHKILVKMVK